VHQNGLRCKETSARNIAPERTIYRIVKIFKERFNCTEEDFMMSQSVQKAAGPSPPEESAMETYPHQ